MRRSSSGRARIGAAGEIERAAVGPEALPVRRTRRARRGDRGGAVSSRRRRERRRCTRSRASRRWLERETRAGLRRSEAPVAPGGARPVAVGVERALPASPSRGVAVDDVGAVQLGVRPVRGIAGVRRPRIRERDAHGEPRRDQAAVLSTRTAIRSRVGCAQVSTRTRASVEGERLSSVPDQRSSRCSTSSRSDECARRAVASREHEAHAREREAMRILAQPLPAAPFCPLAYGTCRPCASYDIERVVDLVARRVRERMPAPLGLRRERKLLVLVGKSLKSRRVGGEGEPAIADAQRRERFERSHDGRMARDAALVDRRRPSRRRARARL